MTELLLFEKWVEIKKGRLGFYVAKCKKGNFEVSGANKNRVTQEAVRYFMQYFQDGEYT